MSTAGQNGEPDAQTQVYTPDLFQAVLATAPSLMARGHCELQPTYLPGFSNRTKAQPTRPEP